MHCSASGTNYCNVALMTCEVLQLKELSFHYILQLEKEGGEYLHYDVMKLELK